MRLIQCALVVILLGTFAAAQEKLLVKGEPPLTQAMVNQARDFLEWVFETPLTTEQRSMVDEAIVRSWTNSDKQEISGTLELIKAAKQIAAMPEEARASVRVQLQPEIIAGLKADGDASGKWMLAIYDAAHKPIAPGNPPLTKQMSNAQAEMFAFMLGEAAGQRMATDKRFLDEWAKSLIETYPKLSEIQQKQIAKAPIDWANLRFGWSKMNEQQRADARKLWAAEFQGIVQESVAQQKVNAAFSRIEQIFKGKTLEQISAAQLGEAATELDRVIVALGADQSVESKNMVTQVKQIAFELREAASAKNKSVAASTSTSLNKSMQELQARQDSFRNMMNMSMQMNYSRINSTNILSGNPYRYVNSFGRPY